MIARAIINKAVETLRQAAPQATIMLFGSYARGEANDKSDLDLLVVEPGPVSRRIESARLRAILQPLGIPADILVVTKQTFEEWRSIPGMIMFESTQSDRPYPAIRFGVYVWGLLARQRQRTEAPF